MEPRNTRPERSEGNARKNLHYALFFCQLLFFSGICYNRAMYQVRVETSFAAAHFLRDYNGKCENLHGHNYKVFVHVKGKNLDEGGMLLDFSVLKKNLKTVCETLDHKNLNDFEYFDQNPSAERIATYIYEKLVELIPELKKDSESDKKTHIFAVDVFETDTNRARFLPE